MLLETEYLDLYFGFPKGFNKLKVSVMVMVLRNNKKKSMLYQVFQKTSCKPSVLKHLFLNKDGYLSCNQS